MELENRSPDVLEVSVHYEVTLDKKILETTSTKTLDPGSSRRFGVKITDLKGTGSVLIPPKHITIQNSNIMQQPIILNKVHKKCITRVIAEVRRGVYTVIDKETGNTHKMNY